MDKKMIKKSPKNSVISAKLKEMMSKLDISAWGKDEQSISSISTGSFLIDEITGIGGWPRGRIVEIFGADSSGKSTLALHAVAEAQKAGLQVVYLDLERTLNRTWAQKIGVDLDLLLISYPKTGENAFTILNHLVETGLVDCIIVDSVAAMSPEVEFKNDLEDQTMGIHARLMSKGLRILQIINKKTTIIFINQIRDKIGNMFPTTTTTGGRALRFAASMRIEVRKCESIKNSSGIVGFVTKITVVKNKLAEPMKTANVFLTFDAGFDRLHEIVSESVRKKFIEQRGAWFYYGDRSLAQGINAVKAMLKDDEKLTDELKQKSFPEKNI